MLAVRFQIWFELESLDLMDIFYFLPVQALQPFLESLLVRGLERFAKFAKEYSRDSTV